MTRIKVERNPLVNSEQDPGNREIIIPKALLPLEREILMLASTIDPETGKPISLFGYNIPRQLRQRRLEGIDISLNAAATYTTLNRLIGWGLLAQVETPVDGHIRGRKYYSITPAGLEKLE